MSRSTEDARRHDCGCCRSNACGYAETLRFPGVISGGNDQPGSPDEKVGDYQCKDANVWRDAWTAPDASAAGRCAIAAFFRRRSC